MDAHHENFEARREAIEKEQEQAKMLSHIFKILADETRLRILLALYDHPHRVMQLSASLGLMQSTVSHQLSLLKREKLVVCQRVEKSVIYSLADEHIFEMLKPAITHVCEC